MVHCAHCGTTWLARSYGDDPYGRAFPRVATEEVSDAIVIDHIPPEIDPDPDYYHSAPPPRRRANSRLVKGIGAVLGVVVALFALRVPIVEALPQLSARSLPADAEKLAFQRVRSETIARSGVRTLVVEGEIVNRSGSDIAVPAIRISLRSPAGAEVYSWLVEPTAAGIGPGGTVGFRSAVASPPEDASQVTLRLAQRESRTIGMR